MVNGIDEKRLSQKYGNVKVFHFSDARIEDLSHYIVPIIKNKPDYLILHVGTNDATTNSPRKILEDLLITSVHPILTKQTSQSNSQTVESFYQNPRSDMIMERQI